MIALALALPILGLVGYGAGVAACLLIGAWVMHDVRRQRRLREQLPERVCGPTGRRRL